MQPIPECRIRVWKKEWQQTVGSQTSLTTGTRRIANRIEQRSRREGEGHREEREKNGRKWDKVQKVKEKGGESKRQRREEEKEEMNGGEEQKKGEVGGQEADG